MWEGIVSRTQVETENGDDGLSHRLCCCRQELSWALLSSPGCRALAAVPDSQRENGALGAPWLTLKHIRVWDTGAGVVGY